MSNRIEYISGQALNEYGIIYLGEAESRIAKNGRQIRRVLVRCGQCGKDFIAQPGNIKNGHTKSCGCLVSEGSRRIIKEYNSTTNTSWNRKEYHPGDTVGQKGVIYLKEATPYRDRG